MGDDDLARLLPEPPPPRPARREAAIETALRRYDGVEDRPAARPLPVARPWPRLGRTQIGVLASIALVALVGVPAALRSIAEHPPAPVARGHAPVPPAHSPETPKPEVSAPITESKPPQMPMVGPPLAEPAVVPAPAAPVVSPDKDATRCVGGDCGGGESAKSSGAMAAAPANIAGNAMPGSEVADARAARPSAVAPAPPPPRAAAPAEPAAAEGRDDSEVIVTARRVERHRAASRRGDWNACTVNDPDQSLRGCKSMINPSAKGSRGSAAARLAEGLSLAWDGDLDGAIAAFDQAIALDPRNDLAYLNRGLAHQRNDEIERAIADLNLAIRYAPTRARNYYARGQLLAQHGEARRARADAERAVELDRDYAAVVE